jgi:hypothetical protein
VWIVALERGAITAVPVSLALLYTGRTVTRHTIAGAQMLMSALLIQVSGRRIEVHFHIFGSLTFLAFYRDWKVLISASIVVALYYFFRPIRSSVHLWVLVVQPWRWLEHSGWVVFEDAFLIISITQSLKEIKEAALIATIDGLARAAAGASSLKSGRLVQRA